MAHYAILDENNIVIGVIVGKDENDNTENWEEVYSEITGKQCKRTSYNTRGGVYYNPETMQPDDDQTKAFRKNYAGIGYTYVAEIDAFISPKPPFTSWVLNYDTGLYEAPIPHPKDGKRYVWVEEAGYWLEVPPIAE